MLFRSEGEFKEVHAYFEDRLKFRSSKGVVRRRRRNQPEGEKRRASEPFTRISKAQSFTTALESHPPTPPQVCPSPPPTKPPPRHHGTPLDRLTGNSLTPRLQSLNIDKSLDDIITTKKSRSRQAPRGGGIARRGAPARAAVPANGPAGGGQRRAPQQGNGQVGIPGLEGVVGDKIVVSNLPEDVTEQQIRVRSAFPFV